MITTRLRTGFLLAIMIAITPAAPAQATFSSAQLAAISASPPANAALPLALAFQDEDGRSVTVESAIGSVPAVVIFADYTCHTLCGPIVEFIAGGLAKTGLRPGADYHLVVIGINPRDGIDSARAMRVAHIAPTNRVGQAAVFLTGHEAEVEAATRALGLHYAYDSQHDQYAHPAAAYVVDSAGHVRRVLSPIGLDGGDLRLAIIDAGRGSVGNFADQLHLLCYGFDPAKGIYTERITTLLAYAAGATLLTVIGSIFAMVALQRRRTA